MSMFTMGNSVQRGRRIGCRAGLILLGLAPLLVCEGVLRIGGWGRDLPSGDPYVAFDSARPLFVLNPDGSRYQTAANRQTYFADQSFPAVKGANEFRAFVLGGSTVQGRPFSAPTAFPAWLQLGLEAGDDSTEWTVVNCGGISYASYRLRPILREVLSYQPDLIVIYTGNNEFLEKQMIRAVKEIPAWRRKAGAILGRLYSCRVLASWVGIGGTAGRMPSEVDALLDYRGGLEYYQRDDALRRRTIQQFERNLERMIRTCRDAGIPALLMNPVSNLKDSPPFKVANDDSLSTADREAFALAWDEARDANLSPAQRRSAIQHALAIDDRHAGAHFLLGLSWWDEGQYPAALASLTRAKDEDICPLRALEPMHEAVMATARAFDTPLVDVRALVAERCIGGIPDDTWLLDHVHPSIRGHQVIADALLAVLADGGTVALSPGWEERRDRLTEKQFASLDDAYHVRGQRQLRNLRLWAQGRSQSLRSETTDLHDSVQADE